MDYYHQKKIKIIDQSLNKNYIWDFYSEVVPTTYYKK